MHVSLLDHQTRTYTNMNVAARIKRGSIVKIKVRSFKGEYGKVVGYVEGFHVVKVHGYRIYFLFDELEKL